MPFRIDAETRSIQAVEGLLELGALDIDVYSGGVAAILPDGVAIEAVIRALGSEVPVRKSKAVARDGGSVWLLQPQTTSIGGIAVGSPSDAAAPGLLRLIDSPAFGSGHHPTTALCLELLQDILQTELCDSMLDVGTGSGILALAALLIGVSRVHGIDIDAKALAAAHENARLNAFEERLVLTENSPESLDEQWPLVVANILAAPLIEMAPALVRLVGKSGQLLLSGIPISVEPEVRRAYQHLGMRYVGSRTRAGWTALLLQASW